MQHYHTGTCPSARDIYNYCDTNFKLHDLYASIPCLSICLTKCLLNIAIDSAI